MKHFAVIIVLVFGCNSLLANNQNREIGKILFQSYDSIRNEMIKTACEIGGIKDSALLKMISEGRVDSALANSQITCQIKNFLEQIITNIMIFLGPFVLILWGTC